MVDLNLRKAGKPTAVLVAGAVLLSSQALADNQPYAGQEAREIASLSQSDIDQILAGHGWGLAKPAELNGYPGPAHVLELAEELGLSGEQLDQVQAVFDRMQAAARAAGQDYVEAERHLSTMFRMGHASNARMQSMLADSAAALGKLREVHLAAHLETRALLSEAQVAAYAAARGYGAAGHDGQGQHGGHKHD